MENMKEIMAGMVEVYNNYLHKTKKIEWKSDEQKTQLQDVVDVILPGSKVDLSCDACITNALAVVLCRYEAMFHKSMEQRKIESNTSKVESTSDKLVESKTNGRKNKRRVSPNTKL